MADLTHRIVLELLAKNKAAGELAAFNSSIARTATTVARLGSQLLGVFGVGAGMYGLKRIFTSVTDAAMEQESAIRRLEAALRISGDATDSNVSQIKRYAAELQKLTIYDDDQIIHEMSLAKTRGAGTKELRDITIAAIGLASAYDKELGDAFRIVTLAAEGETGQLKRMGIVIDQNLSPQEKYNQLLAIGAKNFDMAVAATQTASGSLKQYQNALSDTKEIIGDALLPAMSTFYKTMRIYLEENQADTKAWAEGTVGVLTTVVNAYLKAQKGFADLTERAAAPALIEKTAWDRYLIRYPEEQKRQEEYRRQVSESLARAPFGAPAFSMPTTRIRPAYPEELNKIKTQLRGEQEVIWDEKEKLQKEIAGRLTTLTGKYELPTMDLESTEQVKTWAAESEKTTVDIAASYARMYKDIDSKSAASFQAREQVLQDEYKEYDKVIKDKYALDMWYLDQQEKLAIERAGVIGGPLGGIAAGMDEIGRKALTVGEMFKEATITGVNGFADALSRAIVRSEDLGDALRELSLDIAQTMMKQAIITGISAGWGAIFGGGAPVAHAGGIIGQTNFPTRRVDPGVFAGAPRLHSGLASDEFPAILQRGERVIPRRGLSAGGSSSNQRLEALMGQVVSLLSQRQTINLSAKVVDSRDVVTGEQMEGKRGEKFVMHHVGRNS